MLGYYIFKVVVFANNKLQICCLQIANTFGKIDKDNFAALKRMTEEIISSKQSASKVAVHNLCNMSGEKSQPLETLCGQHQTKDTAAPIFWKYEVKQEKFVQQCNLIGHAVD